MKINIFQIHKRSSYVFQDIQDKYGIDTQKGIYAVSDGATQGFMSQLWAEKLVKSFIENPTFEPLELLKNFKEEALIFDNQNFDLDPNPAIKALQIRKQQMGGFATFMGVKIENNRVKYISSGDVCGAIFSNGNIRFFPFQSLEELDKDKGFWGTKQTLNDEIKITQFRQGEITINPNDEILLMTDAIARLTLKNSNIIQNISDFQDFESFKNWIIQQWEAKQLEEDDITVVAIKLNSDNEIKEFLATDVVFPKEEKKIVDFSNPNINQNHLTIEEMKEINRLQNIINQKDIQIIQQNNHIKKL